MNCTIHYRSNLLLSVRIRICLIISISIAIFMSLTGCIDNFEPSIPTSGDLIKFSASMGGDDWESPANSRPVSHPTNRSNDTVYSLTSENDNRSMYLHSRTQSNPINPFDTPKQTSRGSMIEMSDVDCFGLFAGLFEEQWDEEIYSSNYIYNAECNHISERSFATSASYYWPHKNQKIRFWGYAPYNHQSITISSQDCIGSPTITYTTSEIVKNQVDLITTVSDGSKSGDGSQSLMFNHDLTAIQFVAANDIKDGFIKSVSINGIYSKATTKIGSGQWFDYGDIKNFHLDFESKIDVSGVNKNADIAVDDNTFLLLPQVLPEDAEIVVEFIDITNTTRTLRASISGTEWMRGTIVTYYISSNSILYTPIISLSEDNHTFSFSAIAQTKEFSFSSYTEVSQVGAPSTYKVEPYTIQLIDENDKSIEFSDAPYISVNELMQNNNSAILPSSNTLVIGAKNSYGMIIQENNSYDDKLKSAYVDSNIINLAGNDGSETTANCYIISAAGKYKIPLVYGNALDNGSPNKSAYTRQSTNNHTKYLNYKGGDINQPYIYKDVPDLSPYLVWQDVKNLVNIIGIVDNYLVFEISKENIREGNAVIAVKDADNIIVWSWHLWITTYKSTESDSKINDWTLMSKYLGYCHPHTKYYPQRNVKVRITQTETNYSRDIIITLMGKTVDDVGNSVYYQWGRKDAFPGQLLDWKDCGDNTCLRSVLKPIYDEFGKAITKDLTLNERISISKAITIPELQAVTLNKNNVRWYSGTRPYQNLWNANESNGEYEEIAIKTVYDPSPVGYVVAPGAVIQDLRSSSSATSTLPFSEIDLEIRTSSLYFPWTLRKNWTGYYDSSTNSPYTNDEFAIWISSYYYEAVLLPTKLGTSGAIAETTLFDNVALPLLPMRQN